MMEREVYLNYEYTFLWFNSFFYWHFFVITRANFTKINSNFRKNLGFMVF